MKIQRSKTCSFRSEGNRQVIFTIHTASGLGSQPHVLGIRQMPCVQNLNSPFSEPLGPLEGSTFLKNSTIKPPSKETFTAQLSGYRTVKSNRW